MHITADICRQMRNSAIRYNLECAAGYPLEDKQHFLKVSSKNQRLFQTHTMSNIVLWKYHNKLRMDKTVILL